MKFFSILAVLTIILIVPAVYAEVQYPVPELGNCESQQACEAYCDNIQNAESCINFAEKSGMMTAEEVSEARKVLPYLMSGETPGKCSSAKACDEYCNKDENMQECITFAEKAGLITGEELAMIKKTGGKGPGGCKGKKQCDDFCNDESNFAVCVDFAVANGLMDAKDAEIVKKTGGKGPGGCKSKESCDAFCNNEANFATCVDFAVANGMMDAKDAEMAKKTGGKGPGGCKSKEECDAFCDNPDNRETCDNFAIEHGLISPEEIENMKKNQEFMNSEEGKCTTQCLRDAGIDSKACGEDGAGPAACRECGDKCYSNNNGNCLSQERWGQLNQDCQAKGSGYHLEEVKGDDGRGGECIVDENCVYSSDTMWESQEEKDRKLQDMQKQWDEENAQHEAQYGPGSNQDQNPGDQIPQGEQIPQGDMQNPPAGGDSGGTTPGDSGSSGGEGSTSSDGGSSVESSTGTGMVIMKFNSEGIIPRLIDSARNLF